MGNSHNDVHGFRKFIHPLIPGQESPLPVWRPRRISGWCFQRWWSQTPASHYLKSQVECRDSFWSLPFHLSLFIYTGNSNQMLVVWLVRPLPRCPRLLARDSRGPRSRDNASASDLVCGFCYRGLSKVGRTCSTQRGFVNRKRKPVTLTVFGLR